MNIVTVLFGLVFLLCKIHAQICGCGGPTIQPASLTTTVISNPSNIVSAPQTPMIGTTIIDNTLSNALANVLQLLIVSDLIESTLNTALGNRCTSLANPACEPIVTQPIVYTPTIDVITPVVECIPPPCTPVIDFTPPCIPTIDFCPPCGPIYDFHPQCGPATDYAAPCGPVFDYIPACGQIYEPMPNYYSAYTECLTPMSNLATIAAAHPNYCSGMTEFLSPVSNVAPMYTQSFSPNMISGLQDCNAPVQMAPLMPNCYCNGLTEIFGPFNNMGSIPAEILLPPAIPAQLTCNIGSIPSSLPCVSVNVEPVPFGCGFGNNFISNPYLY